MENSTETKPKSRRGRKPKIKTADEFPDLVIRKKRGRKKKCEMYLENVEKIAGYNPNGESIDTIQNKVIFGPTDDTVKDNMQFEKISFGLLKIKRHSNVNTSINKNQKENKEIVFEKNGECLINLDIIVDNITEKSINATKSKVSVQSNVVVKKVEPKKESLTNFLNNSASSSKIINYRKKGDAKIRILKDKEPIRVVKMMHHYNGTKKELPCKTDVWCWWCCHPFDNQPRYLPTKYDELRSRFQVMGNFCSWACVKSFDLNESSYASGKMLLTTLMRTIHGKSYNIDSAPPRSALKVFGGTMSIEEFRNRDKNVYYEINTNRITMDNDYYIKEIKKSRNK